MNATYKIKVDMQKFGKLGYHDLLDDWMGDPLQFDSVAAADLYLKSEYNWTPCSDGSIYAPSSNPYWLNHDQYGIPDAKIVCTATGRQNEYIRAQIRDLNTPDGEQATNNQ